MTIGDAITRLVEVYNRVVEREVYNDLLERKDIDPVAFALFLTMREVEEDAELESR